VLITAPLLWCILEILKRFS
jgi:hypothetical protein